MRVFTGQHGNQLAGGVVKGRIIGKLQEVDRGRQRFVGFHSRGPHVIGDSDLVIPRDCIQGLQQAGNVDHRRCVQVSTADQVQRGNKVLAGCRVTQGDVTDKETYGRTFLVLEFPITPGDTGDCSRHIAQTLYRGIHELPFVDDDGQTFFSLIIIVGTAA